MTTSFSDRVATTAAEVQLVKVLLTILALPFYAVGFVAAVLWLAVRWVYAAVGVGFADARDRWQVNSEAG